MTSPPINGHEPPGLYGWRWNTINADPTLTPAQRACLNAAAHQANVATQPADPIDDAAQDAPRRDATWYRIALAAYTHLHHTGAFSHLDNPPPPAPQPCTADDDTIRAWLTSPSMLPGFEDLTVADSWGITHDFDGGDHLPGVILEAYQELIQGELLTSLCPVQRASHLAAIER